MEAAQLWSLLCVSCSMHLEGSNHSDSCTCKYVNSHQNKSQQTSSKFYSKGSHNPKLPMGSNLPPTGNNTIQQTHLHLCWLAYVELTAMTKWPQLQHISTHHLGIPPPRMAAPKFHFRNKSCQKPWPSVLCWKRNHMCVYISPTKHCEYPRNGLMEGWQQPCTFPWKPMSLLAFLKVSLWLSMGQGNHLGVASPAGRSPLNLFQGNRCNG